MTAQAPLQPRPSIRDIMSLFRDRGATMRENGDLLSAGKHAAREWLCIGLPRALADHVKSSL
jgi:hypothetical protein